MEVFVKERILPIISLPNHSLVYCLKLKHDKVRFDLGFFVGYHKLFCSVLLSCFCVLVQR